MTAPARRLLPSGHEVAECPHCHSIAGVDLATLTASAPIPGTAIRCNACGVRGPIEPDIRRATVGWNNLARLAEIAASLLAMRQPVAATTDGSHDVTPAHVVDDVPAKGPETPARKILTTAEREAQAAHAFEHQLIRGKDAACQ